MVTIWYINVVMINYMSMQQIQNYMNIRKQFFDKSDLFVKFKEFIQNA